MYTQHTPHLAQTLDLLMRGRLKETSYPFLEGQSSINPNSATARPQDIIVFMVGGTTYEEARTVALLNSQAHQSNGQGQSVSSARILLGGTGVLNSKRYDQPLCYGVELRLLP